MKIFFLDFGDLVALLLVFGKFGSTKPLFPLFGSLDNVIDDTVVIAINFLLEELGDSTIRMLISPEVTKFF